MATFLSLIILIIFDNIDDIVLKNNIKSDISKLEFMYGIKLSSLRIEMLSCSLICLINGI